MRDKGLKQCKIKKQQYTKMSDVHHCSMRVANLITELVYKELFKKHRLFKCTNPSD